MIDALLYCYVANLDAGATVGSAMIKITGSMNARSHYLPIVELLWPCGFLWQHLGIPSSGTASSAPLGAAAQFDCRKHARDAPAAIEAAHWRCEGIAGGGAETCAAAQQGERSG
jgi:hypothetical protein